MNEPTLTDELERLILVAIRAGAFPHVAAAACGVPLALWNRWMSGGRRPRAREPLRSFVRKVEEAQGQARLRAETQVLEKDVRTWLKHGPGRDLPDRPGWAAMGKPTPAAQKNKATDWLESPDFGRFVALLQAALAPYPEALAAVTRMLDRDAPTKGKRKPPPEGEHP